MFKQVALINGTCGSKWTQEPIFCQKLALGGSFLDIPLDFRKLPLGLCASTKSWLLDNNIYILRV